MADINIPPPTNATSILAGASLRAGLSRLAKATAPPVAAVLLALLAGAVLLAVTGFNAFDIFTVMVNGVFQDVGSIAEMLLRATPLILIGIGLCVAFRCSIWNIGAEGQFYAGSCAATFCGVHFAGLPSWAHILLILVAGAVAGALWAAIAGLLKVLFNASEIVTTIMLNYIAIFMTSYLVTGPLMESGAAYPQSAKLLREVWLPRVVPSTRLHIGILIAVALATIIYVFLFRSSAGYAVRIVGINSHAARYAGISVRRSILLAISISGSMAGLAGAMQIAGVTHRLYQDISPGYGFEAIAVALLANNNPVGAIFSGILFAVLDSGSELMQINAQVPQVLVFIIQGMVILSVVGFAAFKFQSARPQE
ncbi:ABC transporter permease [Mesorhizobium sp. B2-3-11]|uniref:ABC transporter permease n=1 Tax=Mesorhizobium sp. B2-3-11 TaxID=2589953 RepID=UPI00112B9914|nr:ABC transporter permease [Mesorhizobium sp. B2-3-11]TPM07057.1 ABC transporter permease [Mesorhizobium sp. B2-3-11]